MRIGTTTSVIGHVLLLGWGLVTLPNAQPFEIEQIDALPVDLVSIADVTQISEGTKTAPKRDTASQAEVKTPAPRPESQRAGNAPTEQDAPITEKTTDVAAAPTAEPPPPPPPPPAAPERPKEPTPEPPAPAAEAVPEPQPAAPETPPPPATTEVAELPAAPDEVPAEPAPTPVPPSAKPRAKPQAPDPIQTASVDPKPTPPSTETRRTETRKPASWSAADAFFTMFGTSSGRSAS